MKRIFAAALFICACFASAQAATNCVAQAERKWSGMTIEALSQGDSCDTAVLTLAIRDKDGKPLWVRALVAGQLMNFASEPAQDAKSMVGKLSSWISGEGFMPSADKLVLKGEFPFTRSENLDAKSFAAYRSQKRPIFCFVQGMESGLCLAQDKDGTIAELGFQMFPG
jgi:hypothetical protein